MLWILILGLVLALALAVLVVTLTARPVSWRAEGAPSAVTALERDKERVLRLIKDLDGEAERDVLPREEVAALRDSYLREAALIQRRLARLGAGTSRSDP